MIIGLMSIPNVNAMDSPSLSSPHVDADYNEQVLLQQNNLWYLGKNLVVGDSYTYKICDPNAIQTSAANYHYFMQGNEDHNSSVCYLIKMDFVNLLNSDENQINNSGSVWVVQAAISTNNYSSNRDSNEVRYSIFHVDAITFEVSSADTIHPDIIKYTDSLQDTLFSLFKYTASEPQLLQIGTQWGEVTEALREKGANPFMEVLEGNQEYAVTQNSIRLVDNQNIPVTRDIVDAFKVGYEIDIFDPFILSEGDKKTTMDEEDSNNVTNYFLISSDLPFPLSAVSYSPVHITQPQKQYEFEMVAFLANNKNVDLEIKHVIEEPKEIVIVSEISTETGTIELTFPDENNAVSSNDNDDGIASVKEDVVQIVPNNDEVIDNDDITLVDDEDDIDTIPVVNDNRPIQSDDKDYVGIVGLVILLVAMIAVFVVFKRLKESGFKAGFKKILKKKQKQYTIKDIVQFNDKLRIDIKTITDDI